MRSIHSLVLAIWLGPFSVLASAAQAIVPNYLPGVPIQPRIEKWMMNFGRESIPLLSPKGKEREQFKLILQTLETYKGQRLETEEVAANLVSALGSIQTRINSSSGSRELKLNLRVLAEMSVSIQAHQLVWTYRGSTAGIALNKSLHQVAEESIRKSSALLGRPFKDISAILWFVWVESCLDTLGSRFNFYVYSNELAGFGAEQIGKTFGPGFIPEFSGDRLVVKEVFDPALHEAGLIAGSELIEIDRQPVTVSSPSSFEKWLRPSPFSYRVLFRTGNREKAVRAKAVPFRHPTLSWARFRDVVYVRISGFSQGSLIELRRMFRQIQSMRPRGLILDLRGNPGGVVNFDLVDCFFKPGNAIGTYRKLPAGELQSVPASIEYYDYPCVLLVDRESASMSEVFAAAFLVHKRGVIIGEKTFGKGVGQVCRPVGQEGELCLVQTRYYYPGTEKSWDGEGITPDIQIKISDAKRKVLSEFLSAATVNPENQVESDEVLQEALHYLQEKNK